MAKALSLKLFDGEEELLEKETEFFNQQNNLDLTRQRFLIKLLKDYAKKRKSAATQQV